MFAAWAPVADSTTSCCTAAAAPSVALHGSSLYPLHHVRLMQAGVVALSSGHVWGARGISPDLLVFKVGWGECGGHHTSPGAKRLLLFFHDRIELNGIRYIEGHRVQLLQGALWAVGASRAWIMLWWNLLAVSCCSKCGLVLVREGAWPGSKRSRCPFSACQHEKHM